MPSAKNNEIPRLRACAVFAAVSPIIMSSALSTASLHDAIHNPINHNQKTIALVASSTAICYPSIVYCAARLMTMQRPSRAQQFWFIPDVVWIVGRTVLTALMAKQYVDVGKCEGIKTVDRLNGRFGVDKGDGACKIWKANIGIDFLGIVIFAAFVFGFVIHHAKQAIISRREEKDAEGIVEA